MVELCVPLGQAADTYPSGARVELAAEKARAKIVVDPASCGSWQVPCWRAALTSSPNEHGRARPQHPQMCSSSLCV